MSKKFSSIIIIVITMIYVSVMVYLNKSYENIDIKLKVLSIFESIKINIGNVFRQKNNPKIIYKDMEQGSEIIVDIKPSVPAVSQYISEDSSIKKKVKYKLSYSDKEKLLGYAKKLSPIDQAKINEYLKDLDTADVENTLSLLKTRFTDKEYEKLKVIESELKRK